MWSEFAIAYVVGALVIYLPGLLFFKALRFDWGLALISAPLATICGNIFFTTLYSYVGVQCSGALLCASVLGLFLVMYAFVLLINKLRKKKAVRINISDFNWKILSLYVVFGLGLCVVVFIKNLDGSDSFFCRADNITHLGLVRTFLDSGDWSSLHASNYSLFESDPMGYAKDFYPAAWHQLVALVSDLTGAEITISVNAVNSIFVSLVYPSAMFLLMTYLFKGEKNVVIFGAFFTLAFTAFPWGLFIKGPLYPQLAANCLSPLVMALFARFIDFFLLRKNISVFVIRFVFFGVVAIVSLAFTQTNAIFFVYVFAICFLTSVAYGWGRQNREASIIKRITPACVVLFVGIAFWLVCFNLPFMQSVVTFETESNLTVTEAVFFGVSLALAASMPQWLLAILVLFGVFYCVVKKKIWILVPAAFMLVAYIECKSGSGILKQMIAGFWYADHYRSAACLAIFLVPIASVGFNVVVAGLKRAIDSLGKDLGFKVAKKPFVLACLVVFLVLNFYPNYIYPKSEKTVETGFGHMYEKLETIFSTEKEQVYSSEERNFVKKVKEYVSDDSLIINYPDDGSVFSYSADGLNIVYRYSLLNSRVPSSETRESELVRTRLNKISDDSEVKSAAQTLGAKYVLLLDQGKEEDELVKLPQFNHPEYWLGITGINDLTPGFTTVLAEGDMRLYEIEY